MQTEIERKYDVGPDADVPALAGIGPVAATADEAPVRMSAVYYDTSDRALSRGRITMRRRAGGEDQGWHVKLPGAKARTELHVPLTRTATVPKAVRAPVLAFVGRAPLEKIARLNTTRTVTRLLDASGAQLAELADDLVVAVDLASGEERRWREWEVELKEGAPAGDDERAALLDAVAERLASAGAEPASSVSKLARATGRTGSERPSAGEPGTAGEAAVAAIEALVAELRAADPWVRLDAEDAVHRMRVLTRRLRSVLAGSRRALERSVTDPVREELSWLGHLLGEARDAEVARDRIDAHFDGVPAGDAARRRMHAALAGRYTRAHRRIVIALRGRRYLDLLAALDGLVGAPPVTPGAQESARRFVKRSLRHEARRVADAETPAIAPDADADARHRLRKSAKRLRYVAEAWAQTAPDALRARHDGLAAAAEELADVLGAERDAAAAQTELRSTAEVARRAREDTFGYGVAWAAARDDEAAARGAVEPAVTRLRSALRRA